MLNYDNGGFRTSPHPAVSQPVITQTALLVSVDQGVDAETTVVGGKRYRFTSITGKSFIFGLATTATAANVRWVCPLYGTIEIQIPYGHSHIHQQANANNSMGYLVEIKQVEEDDISA